jgi:hypothetical protein
VQNNEELFKKDLTIELCRITRNSSRKTLQQNCAEQRGTLQGKPYNRTVQNNGKLFKEDLAAELCRTTGTLQGRPYNRTVQNNEELCKEDLTTEQSKLKSINGRTVS